jgi:hypothetical protein
MAWVLLGAADLSWRKSDSLVGHTFSAIQDGSRRLSELVASSWRSPHRNLEAGVRSDNESEKDKEE